MSNLAGLIISTIGYDNFYYGTGLITGFCLFYTIKLLLLLTKPIPAMVKKFKPNWWETP